LLSLTIGSVLGAYSSLVAKVNAIDGKHGKFETVICVGDFFAVPGSEDTELNALLAGEIKSTETPFLPRSICVLT
jgi:hypothetical protein